MKNNTWFKLSRSKYAVSWLVGLIGLMFFFVITESNAADRYAQAPVISTPASNKQGQPAGAGQPAVTQSQSSTKPEIPKPPAIATEKENALITVTALENLTREHGVLSRVFLIYDDIITRLYTGVNYPPDVLFNTATLVRQFIEDYHEPLEERYIFPKFEKAGVQTGLIKVLQEQHQVGRKLTDDILHRATVAGMQDPNNRKQLLVSMRQFIRLYRPHKAREDTVIFPAFRQLVTVDEYAKLGILFEDLESGLFGENGFEKAVDQVASFEKTLSIYELSQFTGTMNSPKP